MTFDLPLQKIGKSDHDYSTRCQFLDKIDNPYDVTKKIKVHVSNFSRKHDPTALVDEVEHNDGKF